MAKKSSKQQPRQPNAANIGDTVTIQTTNQPDNAPPVDAHATRLSFFHFITIATTEDIKKFLAFTATTPEGENLEYLWERAYEDGYKNGRKSLLQSLERNLEEKFEKGVEKGMDLGREEGYTIAKEGFDEIMKVTRAREATKAQALVEKGVDARLAPTAAVSTQTTALIVTAPLTTSMATQTDSPRTSTTPITTQTESPALTTDATSQTELAFVENGSKPNTDNTNGPFYELTTTYNDRSTQTNPTTLVTTSQLPELPEYRKNTKMSSTSEILPYTTDFSPSTQSVTSSELVAPAVIASALETRPTAGCTQKCENFEESSISIQNPLTTHSTSILEPTDDIARVHTPLLTSNDVISRPSTLTESASSSSDCHGF